MFNKWARKKLNNATATHSHDDLYPLMYSSNEDSIIHTNSEPLADIPVWNIDVAPPRVVAVTYKDGSVTSSSSSSMCSISTTTTTNDSSSGHYVVNEPALETIGDGTDSVKSDVSETGYQVTDDSFENNEQVSRRDSGSKEEPEEACNVERDRQTSVERNHGPVRHDNSWHESDNVVMSVTFSVGGVAFRRIVATLGGLVVALSVLLKRHVIP